MTQSVVPVVIVNFNAGARLADCVESVLRSAHPVVVGDVSVMGNAGAAIQNASIMLITFWVIQKMFCCGSTAGCAPGCTCSKGGPCICPKK
jgi:hypothetical protein